MKKKRQTIIELTPLLDVILIILFMVMSQNANAIKVSQKDADEEKKQMQTELSDLKTENARLKNDVSSRESIVNYANRVSISYSQNTREGDILFSYIPAGDSSPTDSKTVPYKWGDETAAKNELIRIFNDDLNEDIVTFVVFAYDSDVIYSKAYDVIDSVLNDMSRSKNVTVEKINKGNIVAEGEKDE